MNIYVDSLFMLNFTMNYIILFFTGKVTNRKFGIKVKMRKYVLGSLLTTALYITILLTDILRNNFNTLYAIGLISIGVLITFKPKNMKVFFTYLIYTHLVAFSIGGITFGIFYYTKAGALIGNTVQATLNNISIKLLISSTCIAYLAIRMIVNRIEKSKLSNQVILEVNILSYKNNQDYSLDDIESEVKGEVENEVKSNIKRSRESNNAIKMLVDTGNCLIEPISKLPVVVVCYKSLVNILSSEVYELYENKKDVLNEMLTLEQEAVQSFKIIPFKSVGCENGLILGIESEISFINEEVEYLKKCIIGIVSFEVAKNDKYAGIFNPKLLEEDIKNVNEVEKVMA